MNYFRGRNFRGEKLSRFLAIFAKLNPREKNWPAESRKFIPREMDKISKIFMFDTSILIFTVNIPKQPQNKNRKNKKNEKSRKFISRENHLFFHSRKYIPKISLFFLPRETFSP